MYRGIAISKAKLHAGRLNAAGPAQPPVVETSRPGLALWWGWPARHGATAAQLHAVREATGVYPDVAAPARFEAGVTGSIGNPAHAQAVARGGAVRTHPAGVAGHGLARVGALRKPPAGQPPDPAGRELQTRLARRDAVAPALRRDHNRRDQAVATAPPPRGRPSRDAAITCLEKELGHRQQDLNDQLNRHPGLKAELARLTPMPAVGPQGGRQRLAVRHSHCFQSAEQLAAYWGRVPVERPSGTSLHGRPHRAKAGPARRRASLYLAAGVATRYHPPLTALYERLLARGQANKAALGAARRKLVHRCVGVLKNRQPYQAADACSP